MVQLGVSLALTILYELIVIFFKLIHILMLKKRRPTQFTGFVENKNRHEHVMITKLYIVSHILYDHHLYEYIL